MVGELFAILRVELAMGGRWGADICTLEKYFITFGQNSGGISPETRLVALMDKQAFTEMVKDD